MSFLSLIPARREWLDAGADINDMRTHRFRLWRAWGPGQRLAWLMMNPSTADEDVLDPTLRRCVGFAKAWGYDGIEIFNVATLRTPSPATLVAAHKSGLDVFMREQRNAAILATAPSIGRVIVAWGACALTCEEAASGGALFTTSQVMCLGKTLAGHPRHPLYLRADTLPEAWASILERA